MCVNSGIYKIENLENGKRYIGSAVDLRKRRREHFRLLLNNTHTNPHLQRSYNKYGKDVFVFEVLEHCSADKEVLLGREQQYIDGLFLEVPFKAYNISPTAGSNAGVKFGPRPKEVGRKISAALTGNKLSEKHKKNLSKAHKGKVLSEEHKKKISEALMGKEVSNETRMKLSLINKGENNPRYGPKRKRLVVKGIEYFECCRCNRMLTRDMFHRCITVVYGVYYSCKKCRSVYRKKRYKEKRILRGKECL